MLGKLKQCLKKRRSKKKGYYYNLVEIKGKEVSLEQLDGHKIISYWYDDFCRFLKDMAKYIEGLIIFEFETMAEGPAYMCFEDGKVKIHLPVWHELTPDDLIRARRQRKKESNKQYKSETRAQVPRKTGNGSVGRRKNRCKRCGRFIPKGTVTCCSFDYLTKGVRP
jgi:hypothetical protein